MDRSDGKTRKKMKKPLDDFKARRGYWKLKEEALECTVRRTGFGRGYRQVVRHTE
jgi:hypothetical protein